MKVDKAKIGKTVRLVVEVMAILALFVIGVMGLFFPKPAEIVPAEMVPADTISRAEFQELKKAQAELGRQLSTVNATLTRIDKNLKEMPGEKGLSVSDNQNIQSQLDKLQAELAEKVTAKQLTARMAGVELAIAELKQNQAGIYSEELKSQVYGAWFTSGNYQFEVRAETGEVRLYFDGELLIDEWGGKPTAAWRVEKQISAGYHKIRFEFKDKTSSFNFKKIS